MHPQIVVACIEVFDPASMACDPPRLLRPTSNLHTGSFLRPMASFETCSTEFHEEHLKMIMHAESHPSGEVDMIEKTKNEHLDHVTMLLLNSS